MLVKLIKCDRADCKEVVELELQCNDCHMKFEEKVCYNGEAYKIKDVYYCLDSDPKGQMVVVAERRVGKARA